MIPFSDTRNVIPRDNGRARPIVRGNWRETRKNIKINVLGTASDFPPRADTQPWKLPRIVSRASVWFQWESTVSDDTRVQLFVYLTIFLFYHFSIWPFLYLTIFLFGHFYIRQFVIFSFLHAVLLLEEIQRTVYCEYSLYITRVFVTDFSWIRLWQATGSVNASYFLFISFFISSISAKQQRAVWLNWSSRYACMRFREGTTAIVAE